MAQQQIGIGARVAWAAGTASCTGTVVTYRDVGGKARCLGVRTDDGRVVYLYANDVQALEDGASTVTVDVVDPYSAMKLARVILAGGNPRRPVQQQLRELALALVGQETAA